MHKDELVHDKLGWVDDFRALPGECGSLFARRIYLRSLLSQGTSIRQIKNMGFSKEMVSEMSKQLVNEEFGPKIGDLVRFVAAPPRWKGEEPRAPEASLMGKTGVVTGYAGDDAHEWGGIWNLYVDGDWIQHYGDFMEVINDQTGKD